MFQSLKLQKFIVWPVIFCKEFASQQEKYRIEDKNRHHNKPGRMSDFISNSHSWIHINEYNSPYSLRVASNAIN